MVTHSPGSHVIEGGGAQLPVKEGQQAGALQGLNAQLYAHCIPEGVPVATCATSAGLSLLMPLIFTISTCGPTHTPMVRRTASSDTAS